MSQLPNLEFVTWDQFQLMGYQLAQQIKQNSHTPDRIVTLARGGHAISRILSDFLGIKPMYNISIQSYVSIGQQQDLEITQRLESDLSQYHVLVVDEIVDTGNTLRRSLEHIEELQPKSVLSAALHIKPHRVITPDFFIKETTNWVVYPYEVYESVEALSPLFIEAGKSEQELLQTLVAGGMNEQIVRAGILELKSAKKQIS